MSAAPAPDLGALFDEHVASEFVARDVDATMGTMTDEPYVWHVPALTGAAGRDAVRGGFFSPFLKGNTPPPAVAPGQLQPITDGGEAGVPGLAGAAQADLLHHAPGGDVLGEGERDHFSEPELGRGLDRRSAGLGGEALAPSPRHDRPRDRQHALVGERGPFQAGPAEELAGAPFAHYPGSEAVLGPVQSIPSEQAGRVVLVHRRQRRRLEPLGDLR